MKWEPPKNVTEVRSFLGVAGYYRRFVEGFSKLAMPMTHLTKKGDKFLWTLECELVFHTLKEKLTTAPVLIIPNSGEEYEVYTDASLRGLGCKSPTPGPTHTKSHPHVVSTHKSIRASPLPFSFASVRARTQDHRDILKWGALSLPTELQLSW